MPTRAAAAARWTSTSLGTDNSAPSNPTRPIRIARWTSSGVISTPVKRWANPSRERRTGLRPKAGSDPAGTEQVGEGAAVGPAVEGLPDGSQRGPPFPQVGDPPEAVAVRLC